jgi:hypothetical protein
VSKSHSACKNHSCTCWNHSRESLSHIRAFQNHTACGNRTLRMVSHSVCTPKEKTGEIDQIFLVNLLLINRPKTGGKQVISTIKWLDSIAKKLRAGQIG